MFLIMIFFYITILLCISVGSTNEDYFSNLTSDYYFDDDWGGIFRNSRDLSKKGDSVETEIFKCEDLYETSRYPFLVLILYKSSGRFTGMGSIIERRTVLSTKKVVEKSLHIPRTLLTVAGRSSPWWGRYSQIRHAQKIFINDYDLAIVKLDDDLLYTKNVLPVGIALSPYPTAAAKFKEKFGTHYTGFGIPVEMWTRPGDRVKKTATYAMRTEFWMDFTTPGVKPHKNCTDTYPQYSFSTTYWVCTYANATFCWGSLGSPTISLTKDTKKLEMFGVLEGAGTSEFDEYHMHLRLAPFQEWIKVHSPLAYLKEVDKITGR